MNREEAFAQLNIDSEQDAEDGFETALFQAKQFFLTKPVFLKTFESKALKLEKQYEAFVFLGGEPEVIAEPVPMPAFHAGADVLEQLSAYHQAKNTIKQRLSAADSCTPVLEAVRQLVELERSFTEPFSIFRDWSEEPVTFGKEPDVMLVFALLREQADKGLKNLKELHENKNNLPNELLLVLKRLSLLKNYLYA